MQHSSCGSAMSPSCGTHPCEDLVGPAWLQVVHVDSHSTGGVEQGPGGGDCVALVARHPELGRVAVAQETLPAPGGAAVAEAVGNQVGAERQVRHGVGALQNIRSSRGYACKLSLEVQRDSDIPHI
jgi:hypothetical protein